MKQRENRSKRTSPASKAEKTSTKKSTNAGTGKQKFTCDKCDFTAAQVNVLNEHMEIHRHNCDYCQASFNTKGMCRRHLKEMHNICSDKQPRASDTDNGPEKFTCEKCDFQGKSKLQMEKHMKVRHGFRAVCHFWRKGFCKNGNECPFSHPHQPPVCVNGDCCLFWPQCKFSHQEVCKFQNACKHEFCAYLYVSNEDLAFLGDGRTKKNHPSPVWRP